MSDITARFARETAEHQMTVLHNDGLYRHLRFRSPKSSMYWFDLITVPGALIFQGDGDSFVFRRLADMFEFFRGPVGQINPGYWTEKMTSGRDQIMKYDQELLAASVKEAISEHFDGETIPDGLDDAVRYDVLDELTGDESIDRQMVESFEFYANASDRYAYPKKTPDFRFGETWEWDVRDYDWWVLWACNAIVWGIAQFDVEQPADPAVVDVQLPAVTLTDRQMQVLVGISKGYTYPKIGRQMGTTVDGVKSIVSRLFPALGAHDRAGAVHIAWKLGILGGAA